MKIITLFHPLLPLTAAFIAGIIWQAYECAPWVPIMLMGASALMALGAKEKKYTLFVVLVALFFLTGAMRYGQQITQFTSLHDQLIDKNWTAQARIVDVEASHKKAGQTIFTVEIQKLRNKDNTLDAARGSLLQISTMQPHALKVGDRVSCVSLYFRPVTNNDYKRYLIKEQLLGQLTCSKPPELIQRPSWSVKRWFVATRNRIIETLYSKLSPTTATLCASIFWGKKTINADHIEPIKEQFKYWGIIHYLARSGLHLVIFVMLWNWLMGFVPLPFSLKHSVVLGLIFGYLWLSWSSISFIRSVMLFVFYKICVVADLQINALYLLTLTCLIILLSNPLQLFFLDFQLSFALTFALALISFFKSVAS